jgi:hypothetical protein
MGARTGVAYEGTRYVPTEQRKPITENVLRAWLEKLLSLVTFFAAAKKVTPPPGRRLLKKQQEKSSSNQNTPPT